MPDSGPMRLIPFAVLVLLGCGAGKPGPQPNVTYFWKITKATTEFNSMCTDNAQFRADNTTDIKPDEDANGNGVLDPGEDLNGDGLLTPASYLVYKASEDAKKATLMKCTRLDP